MQHPDTSHNDVPSYTIHTWAIPFNSNTPGLYHSIQVHVEAMDQCDWRLFMSHVYT